MSELNNNYEKEVQEIIDIMEDKKAQDIKLPFLFLLELFF